MGQQYGERGLAGNRAQASGWRGHPPETFSLEPVVAPQLEGDRSYAVVLGRVRVDLRGVDCALKFIFALNLLV